jgi:glycosyltransferase involved in cell wall biosynthesis
VRILMLAQWYPPILGGEELHVRTLARTLAARGHTVTVATLWHPGMPFEEVDGGVRVVRLKASVSRVPGLFADDRRRSLPPFPDPELALSLGRLARSFDPDVVHAHNWMIHSYLPVRATHRAPLVLTLHDFSLRCATKVLLNRGRNCSGPAFEKCLRCASAHYGAVKGPTTFIANLAGTAAEIRLVDRFVAVSRDVAVGNALGGVPHEVIPNFAVRPTAPAAGVDAYVDQLPDEPFILFVGALGRLKGLHVLLEAYRGLSDPPPLVLIGYPMPESVRLLGDLPSGVRLLGQWPPEAVPEAWRRAAFGVVPSICREACPTVVIEGMIAGRPVIGSRIGGIPDLIVDGETGLLVPPGDPLALRQAMAELIDDPQRARRMGAAADARGIGFEADEVVPRIEAVYRELVEAARSAA